MARIWKQAFWPFLAGINRLFQWKDNPLENRPTYDLLTSLEQARREWIHAKNYFNCVSDNDLIDHAIFYMGATEKKYIYLLKQARENGISIDGFRAG